VVTTKQAGSAARRTRRALRIRLIRGYRNGFPALLKIGGASARRAARKRFRRQ
jgi:hypothetical protein